MKSNTSPMFAKKELFYVFFFHKKISQKKKETQKKESRNSWNNIWGILKMCMHVNNFNKYWT